LTWPATDAFAMTATAHDPSRDTAPLTMPTILRAYEPLNQLYP
jgi:hypothetical protein